MDPSDETLVARARSGETAAFDSLVRRHYRAGYAVALAFLADEAEAEDVCQDSWVKALERLEDCRHPDRFVFWFLQIVRNKARNRLDHRRVRASVPLDPESRLVSREDPRVDLDRVRVRDRLEDALRTLSVVQREIVLLHDLHGFSHPDIAKSLGISEVSSRQHLFQARRRLREKLGTKILGELDHDR